MAKQQQPSGESIFEAKALGGRNIRKSPGLPHQGAKKTEALPLPFFELN
jgi:hypothetical protein